jgi:hypothetical protein
MVYERNQTLAQAPSAERDTGPHAHGFHYWAGDLVPVMLFAWLDGGALMWIVHQRMAELWTINRQRELTQEEMTELLHCLAANVQRAWEIAKLKNLSLLAHMTNDTEWQHELCAKLEKLTG